jgi:serine protease Do
MVRWLVLGTTLALLLGCNTSTPPRDTHAVIEEAVASSVQVFAEGEHRRRSGSAVVLGTDETGERSLVLTSAHFLTPLIEQRIYLRLTPDGEPVPASLLALDEEADLALLATAAIDRRPVRRQNTAGLGQQVWVVAYPWGRERTVIRGAVSQVESGVNGQLHGPVRLIDASVTHGMSGGGVFEASTGRLVGLVQGYRTAQMTMPGGGDPLVFPVAGETTVISGRTIRCFLTNESVAPYLDATTDVHSDCR